MRIVTIVARILFGLVFTAAGLMGFVIVATHTNPSLPPGLANDFVTVSFRSGWVLFVDAVELITGIMLLINRYVALALVTSAAVLANILVFHITMMPTGIVPGLVLCVCWIIVARSVRDRLQPLLLP